MAQLYAACRQAGVLIVKHVQLTNQVQGQLDGIFQAQDAAFMQGINDEIDFTGDWKPDADEIMIARNLNEAQTLLAAANQNAVALPALDVNNFENENVKALFTAVGVGQHMRLLVQSFGPQQILGSSRLAFLHDGNVFRRLTEAAFSIDTKLLATIDAAGNVRFKSFAMLRRIFDLSQFYRAATDAEVIAFCGHNSLHIADQAAFVANADEGIRKAIHQITKLDVFNTYGVPAIATQAAAIGFPLVVNNGSIEVPQGRKDAKALFSFLLDKVYLGPLAQTLYITNSNRLLN